MDITDTIRKLIRDEAAAVAGGAAAWPDAGVRYVDSVNGQDANDGLSPGSAKRTIQSAYTALPSSGGEIIGSGDFDVYNGGTGLAVAQAKPVSIVGRGRGSGPPLWPLRLYSSGNLEALVTLANATSGVSNGGGVNFDRVTFDMGTTAVLGLKGYAWTHVFLDRCRGLGSVAGTGKAAFPQFLTSCEVGDSHGNDNSWWRLRDCYAYQTSLSKVGDFTTTMSSVSLTTAHSATINVPPGSIAKWPTSAAIATARMAAVGINGTGGILANVQIGWDGVSLGTGPNGADQLTGVFSDGSYGPIPAGTMVGLTPTPNCNQHVFEGNIQWGRSSGPALNAAIELWGGSRCVTVGNNFEATAIGVRHHRSHHCMFFGDGGESCPQFYRAIGDSGTSNVANMYVAPGDSGQGVYPIARSGLLLDDGPAYNMLLTKADAATVTNPDTTGLAVGALETEVNEIKAVLRKFQLIA